MVRRTDDEDGHREDKKVSGKNTHGEDLKDAIVLPSPLFCIKMFQAKHSRRRL